jgi:hypothetical protein
MSVDEPIMGEMTPSMEERVRNLETLLTSIESEVLVLRLELEEIQHEIKSDPAL